MRICISGFYGFGNMGDEAILQSIMDELGRDNYYIISTSLPYCNNSWNNYYKILTGMDYKICDVRSNEDLRTDFDYFILGGGELNFSNGWRQCISVFAKKLDAQNIKCMNYAVGYNKLWYYSDKLHKLYYEFLKNFDIITVRDIYSLNLLKEIGIGIVDNDNKLELTFDMGILLKEEKFKDEKNELMFKEKEKVVVFPRYEDYGIGSNKDQLDWLLRDIIDVEGIRGSDVVLVACGPRSIEGVEVDLELCRYLNEKIPGSQILNISPFEPGKIKYLISKSRLVYSGGRYHPIVFAIGYGVPFKMSLTGFAYVKNCGVMDMFRKYGRDGLIELAKLNKKIFFEMVDNGRK